MIRRSVKIQLVAFAVIILAGLAYVGGNYVGISVPGHGPFTVTVYLHNGTGLYPNATVTDRGVVVGKVDSMTVVKTPQGANEVRVVLGIDHGTLVPAGSAAGNSLVQVKVADLSAVGEQYLELLPQTSGGPYLGPGHDVIEAAQTTTPPDIGSEVLHLNQLLTSVNTRQLSDVIKQLGIGFDNLGPILSHLIQNGDALTKSAIAALPSQLKLIDDGVKVLDTQNSVAGELKAYARTFRQFSAQLDDSDAAIRGVIDNGIPAAVQLSKLLNDNAPILPTLLDNLTTVQGIQAVRLPDLQAIFELYPADTSAGFLITNGDGVARFGNVTDPSQPCGATPNTDGFTTPSANSARYLDQPSGWGGSVDLSSYCHGKGITTTLRGSRNTPHLAPGNPNITGTLTGSKNPATVARERKVTCPVVYVSGLCGSKGQTDGSITGSSAGSKAADSSADSGLDPVVTTTYDPNTGMVTGLDGKKYMLGYDGPTAPVFGSNSWQWLLFAPAMK